MSRLASLKRALLIERSYTKQRSLREQEKLEAFQTIFTSYSGYIRSLLYRMRVDENDSDDLLQDIFLKAWKAQGEFKGDSQMKTWLSKIAINHVIDHFRKSKPNTSEFDESAFAKDQNRISYEARELAEKALSTLSPEMRATFVLHAIEGFNLQETGKILDIPTGTVKSRVYHSRLALKAALDKLGVSIAN